MFKQKPPGEGGMSRPVQFSYTPTLPGQDWTAFLAGPVQWLECHTRKDQTSKPCLAWMTDRALPCPRCIPTWDRETLGYVPLYRESDHRECVVIVRETCRDLLEGLEFPAYVVVAREGGKKDSVYVSKHTKSKPWRSTLARRKVPADLEYSLLTMWKINELTEWMRCRPGSLPVPPVKEIPAEATPAPKPTAFALDLNEIAKAVENQGDRARETAQRAGMTAEFLRRKAAERNGKHD